MAGGGGPRAGAGRPKSLGATRRSGMVSFPVWIPEEMAKRIERQMELRVVGKGFIVTHALDEYLQRLEAMPMP